MCWRSLLLALLGVLAIAVRCWRMDAPFDDHWSWRQSDVAAIARNYFENGYHFDKPQIDWAGDQPGFVGTEFPLLPFAAALIYRLTGAREWVGRLVTIAFFVCSLPWLYLLSRRVFGKRAAFYALVCYGFAPLSIGAGRAFIPDMPSLALALGALHYFWRWIDEGSLADWAASAALLGLSLLIKMPSAVIGAAFLSVLALSTLRVANMPSRRRLVLAVSLGFVALLPGSLWSWHAWRIAQSFYPYHFFGAGGLRLMTPAWYAHIARITFVESLTPPLSLLALAGICATWRQRDAAPFRWWLIAMVAFVVIVGYGNRHAWYQLPLVPLAAIFAGAFLAQLRSRLIVGLALVLFLGWSAVVARAHFIPSATSSLSLGRALRTETPPGALIMIADDGDPTAFYYGHRKGWHLLERDGIFQGNPTDAPEIIANVERLRGRGAGYFASLRGTAWWLDFYPAFADYLSRRATLVSATADYRLYRFNP